MRLTIRHFLFGITLCALALCSGTASADVPVLDARMDTRDSVSLTEYFSVLEDPSGTLTLGELTRPGAPDRFSPSQGRGEALGYSYTRSALWLRLRVGNPGAKAIERQLLISYALLAELDFYRPSSDGTGYEHLALGYARPFAARPHKSRFFVLPVHLQAGATQELYLRVATPNSLNVPAQLWKPESLQAHEHRDYFTQALYFGIVIAIAIYNLMLFLALRDISYLLYVGFAGCVSLALAAFTGIGQEFLWRDLPAWSMMGVNVPTALAGIVILAFVRRVLTTADQAPQLDRLL
ncbi:MAG TPA: 7TM-DISM domain-containing protein, partial [Rhizobacter sp.]|nr:7TM-DISM domain-containing protein [Rhizobacter sp.]